jgi:prophage tail gpP-like protein
MIRSDLIRLEIGTDVYENFSSANVVLSFEDAANSFSFDMFDVWSRRKKPFPYEEGQDAKIYIGDELLIDGIAESVDVNYAASSDGVSYGISIAGRSLTGQLVDCAVDTRTKSWYNKTLLEIAVDIAIPLGLTVKLDPSLAGDPAVKKKHENFCAETGEKGFDCLERAARMAGVIITTGKNGEVLLTRASDVVRDTKIEGGLLPVINASRQGNYTERYSHYLLKGQTPGKDQWFGDKAAKGAAVVTDAQVQRYRPLIVLGESQEGKQALRHRAQWERNVRAGRSKRCTYTLAGFRDGQGDLWYPNTNVPVKDDLLNIDDTLLITRVTFMQSGTTGHAGLELCNKAAFDPLLDPKLLKEGGKWGSWG